MKLKLIASLLVAAPQLLCEARREVPTYEINLDIAPEHRYDALLPAYNETVWRFYTESFADRTAFTDVLYGLSDRRGPENDEQQAEIEGLARESKLPIGE